MQLTSFTDYALRTLIYLGLKQPGEVASVQEIADAFGSSKNYMMKVAHQLVAEGWISTVRGRTGGLQLVGDLRTITVGEVVRKMEPKQGVLGCVHGEDTGCPIHAPCRLRLALGAAEAEFYRVLDGFTLADMLTSAGPMRAKLGMLPVLGATP